MKKILIIGYEFHGYLDRLTTKLNDSGYIVDCITHRQIFEYYPIFLRKAAYISYRLLCRLLSKSSFSPKLYSLFCSKFQTSFIKKIVSQLSSVQFDLVLIVGTHELDTLGVELLKDKISAQKWALYKWDAENRYSLQHIHSYFDAVFSFQLSDSIDGVHFLPNFHFVEPDKNIHVNRDIDLTAVSIFDKARYKELSDFYNRLKPKEYRISFVSNKQLNLPFTTNERVDHQRLLSYYKKSKLVYDFSPKNQSGMSQRVLEALASGCNVVTQNKDALTLFGRSGRVFSPDSFFSTIDSVSITSESIDSLAEQCYCVNWFEEIYRVSHIPSENL